MVFTGADTPIQKVTTAHSYAKEILYQYENPRMEIWTLDKLKQLLKSDIPLSLKILEIPERHIVDEYQSWTKQEYMRNDIFLGDAQERFIDELQQKIPQRSTEHIRITGEPGIGKTRLVLESLREKFSESCLYTDKPRAFLESSIFSYIATNRDIVNTVLVVDDCGDTEMVEIWNKVKHKPQITLITIYNEPGENMRDMVSKEAPPLEDKQIINILKSYNIPAHVVDVWCAECRPSPRAAHIIGENLQNNPPPADILQQPSDIRVWDRLIAAQTELDSQEFKDTKEVLLWISLFKRLGDRTSHTSEYKIIENLLKDKAGINPATLSKVIKKLSSMKILQGSTLQYITPKVLHIWLWRQWHKKYHTELLSLDEIAANAKSDMASNNVSTWYMDMLVYAKGTPAANDIVNDLFKPGGFADRHALLDSHKGADLFYSASKADPRGAVDYIYRHIIPNGKNGLREFNTGEDMPPWF